jgi:hypothetical protein
MRILVIPAIALLVALIAGCDPVGMDETRCYVMGTIYADINHTVGEPDIPVITTGTDESNVTMTNNNGDFFMEIQMYPSQGEVTGLPGVADFGVTAIRDTLTYEYLATDGTIFHVNGGDTLHLYDIDIYDFTED